MKMRKRIAALIAVAMIAALMPMTAFAASTNRVTNIVEVAEDTPLGDDSVKAPELVIDFKDKFTSGASFYLKLENAKWLDGDDKTIPAKEGTVEVLYGSSSDTELEVKTNAFASGEVRIPLNVEVKKGEASVEIIPEGTVVTKGKYVFATTKDDKAKVTVGDLNVIVGKGEMATITIEETVAGALAGAIDEAETITFKLEDPDFTFGTVNADNVEGKRGFSDVNFGLTIKKGKLELTLKKDDLKGKQRGIIEIKDVEINVRRGASEGDVEVFMESDILDDEYLVVAKHGDYSTKLTTKEVKEFTAGRKETLKFKLEQVGAAINTNRSLEFILSEDIKVTKATADDVTIKLDEDEDNEFYISAFDADFTDGDIEFEVEVEIPAKFTGDIMVEALGKAIPETNELKLAEVKAPVTVEVEAMKVDIAQKSNKGGKITITETEKGMLQRGKEIVIKLSEDLVDSRANFINVGDIEIEATGGLKVDDAEIIKVSGDDNTSGTAISMKVTRKSTEAGSIELSGFEFRSGRLLADGAYEIEIGGKAISELDGFDPIAEVDFILVGDQLTKAEVQFVIGSDKFLVDGKEMTMDAAAYIKDGRTMVPVRYLAYALGVEPGAIQFNAGIVTIFDSATRIIQIKMGEKNFVVNGMTIPMSAAAEIIDGRTYVPVTEIGNVFGVTGHWDAATQTATFK